MPTINQLIRKGRKDSQKLSKSPALNRGYNSLKSRQDQHQLSTETRSMHPCRYHDTKETKLSTS